MSWKAANMRRGRATRSDAAKRSAEERRCPTCDRKGALSWWIDFDADRWPFKVSECRYCKAVFRRRAKRREERDHETEGSQAEEGVQTDTQQEVEHDEGGTAGVAPPAEGA